MRNLEPLPDDPLAVYDALVEAKKDKGRKLRLRNLRGRITCAYLRYYAHRPALERLRPLGRRLNAEEADDLRACYSALIDNRSPTYSRFYARIRALSPKCAYCSVDNVVTLDHYFPKSGARGYPEFAILPVNLVPSCVLCNTPRDVRDQAGRRALIHPYFDRILQERLLFADVSVRSGVPEAAFRVDLNGCSDAAFGELYERHVGLLGLLERFQRHVMLSDGYLPELTLLLRSLRGNLSVAEVATVLEELAYSFDSTLGVNHYKPVLVRGAVASSEFLDFCLRGAS